MKRTNTQKGITLIALIITIVVLLILAVVAIRAVQGDGIINYAKNARDDYQRASAEENQLLQNLTDYITDNVKNEEELEPGLYAEDGTKSYSWQKLLDDNILYVNDGILTSNSTNTAMTSSTSTAIAGKLIIDKKVTSIGSSTFYGCSNLTEVIIPDTVESIEVWAFYGCSNLTEVIIPDSVTNLGNAVFNLCTNLTSVKIGDNVTSIGLGQFRHCTSLKTIYIPGSVTTFVGAGSGSAWHNNSAFEGCSSELKIYCGASEAQSGWATYWNYYASGSQLSVTYGVTRAEYEQIISNS